MSFSLLSTLFFVDFCIYLILLKLFDFSIFFLGLSLLSRRRADAVVVVVVAVVGFSAGRALNARRCRCRRQATRN